MGESYASTAESQSLSNLLANRDHDFKVSSLAKEKWAAASLLLVSAQYTSRLLAKKSHLCKTTKGCEPCAPLCLLTIQVVPRRKPTRYAISEDTSLLIEHTRPHRQIEASPTLKASVYSHDPAATTSE